MSIDELEKPRQQWCEHCDIGVGCKIYESKPASCSGFYCGYLLNAPIGEEWRPDACKMVLHYEPFANRIVVHVDSGRRDVWLKEPHYSQIKEWAERAAENEGQVIVWQGLDAIAVLPDREINLGRVRQDQHILTHERRTPFGSTFDVIVVEADDPRVVGALPAQTTQITLKD